jgi:sensitive to high expression protein 9
MQPAPLRLSLAIRNVFQASRPIRRSFADRRTLRNPTCSIQPRVSIKAQVRWYVDQKEVDKQIDEIKSRIDGTIEGREDPTRKDEADISRPSALNPDTTIHTTSGSPSSPSTSDTPRPQDRHRLKTSPFNSSTLPSALSATRSHLTTRLTTLLDTLQSRLFTASRHLNDLTGYTGIEALKLSIDQQETQLTTLKSLVTASRAAYTAAVATRSTTQREVNDLLHRKSTWSPTDLERFTHLYRSDHENETAEGIAAQRLADAESQYEEASARLGKSILARYHEEQIWSDKIRQMSTWGTWGLMGLNVLLFIVFQVAVEPWRRRRLVRGFEEKVQEALRTQQSRHEGEMGLRGAVVKEVLEGGGKEEDDTPLSDSLVALVVDSVTGSAESDAEILAEEMAMEQLVTAELKAEHETSSNTSDTNTFTTPPATGYAYYEGYFRELFSEKRITLSQRDLTTVAIEGACGGAAVMGLLLVLLRPR